MLSVTGLNHFYYVRDFTDMTYGGHIQLLHLVEQAKGSGVDSDDIRGSPQE